MFKFTIAFVISVLIHYCVLVFIRFSVYNLVFCICEHCFTLLHPVLLEFKLFFYLAIKTLR
jgi:hypothetical protein